MEDDGKDGRFTHLLHPIRDLAQNWNIDVAKDLEEYLEELENVQISFDGGKTSLNFAQAALMIQGSACIYSRKVEYLYALIYQTLDSITTQAKKGKRGAGGGDPEANALAEEADEEFLLLDDVVEPAPPKAIDLPEDAADVAATAALAAGFGSAADAAAGGSSGSGALFRRASAELLSKTPLALLARSRFDRGGSAGAGMAGGAGGGGGAGDFRLSSVHIARSGALLLAPPGGAVAHMLPLLQRSFSRDRSGGGAAQGGSDGGNASMVLLNATGMGDVSMAGAAAAPSAPALAAADSAASSSAAAAAAPSKRVTFAGADGDADSDDGGGAAYAAAAAGGDDGYDVGGGMGADHTDDGRRDNLYGGDDGDYTAAATDASGADAAAAAGPARRSSRRGASTVNYAGQDGDVGTGDGSGSGWEPSDADGGGGGDDATPAEDDPWLQLDPNADSASTHRPYRKGRTYLVLRDARAVARLGVYGAAAAAMAEAASGAKAGSAGAAGAKEARALMARAKALAAKAAALRAAAPTVLGTASHATKASAAAAAAWGGTPAAALALAAATQTVNHAAPVSAASADGGSGSAAGSAAARMHLSAPLALTPASITGAGPLLAEAEPLFRRHRATASRARAAARRSVNRSMTAAAAVAGAAYGLGDGDDDDDDDGGGAGYAPPAGPGARSTSGNILDGVEDDSVPVGGGGGDDGYDAGGGMGADHGRGGGNDGRRDNLYGGDDYGGDGAGGAGGGGGGGGGVDDPLSWLNDPTAQVRASSGGAYGPAPPSASKAAARRALLASQYGGGDDAPLRGMGSLGADGSGAGGDDADFGTLVARYMLQIRQHIDSAAALTSASESDMHKRVAAWQEQLTGVLAAEEGRREFDIVSYGGEVLGRLSAAAALLDTSAASAASAAASAAATADAAAESAGPSVVLDFALVVPTAAEARRDAKGEGADGEENGGSGAAPAHDSDAENDDAEDEDPAYTSRFEVCRTFLAALQLANNGNVEILPGGSGNAATEGDPAALASSLVGGGSSSSSSAAPAQPAHLVPFRAIFGRGGAAKAKGAAGGDDGGWAFSQAPVYAADDEGGDAAAAAAAASSAGAQSIRSAALAAGFVDPTLSPSFTGAFRLKLLSAVPRVDVDGFTAPSAAENVAGGKAPDAGFTGTVADVDPADVAALLADAGGSDGRAPTARGRGGTGSRAKRGDKLSASPPPAAKRAATDGGLLAAAAAAAAADAAGSPAGGDAAPKGRKAAAAAGTKVTATLAAALGDDGGDDAEPAAGSGGGHGKRARLGRG